MPGSSSPELKMLWETMDPREVLATRFGFRDAAAAARWVTETLLDSFGVRVDTCQRIVMSDHNALAWVVTASGPMLAKWSIARDGFERLDAVAGLTAWLAARGLPVSAPVPALDGRRQIQVGAASLGLQRTIDGDLLDVADPEQVRAAGVVLASVHEALSAYPEAGKFPIPSAPASSLTEQVASWLDRCPQHVPGPAREALRAMVSTADADLLPMQLVHGDYRSANILCFGTQIRAVLDFEEARRDHRVMELARSAVLLGTRFHDWGPVSAEVRATFLDGYESVAPLTPSEASWWDALVLWSSLLFFPTDDPADWGPAPKDQLG